jgi:hypothetical protein
MPDLSMTEVLPALPANYFLMECCVTSVWISLCPYIELFGVLKRASRGIMILFSIDVPLVTQSPELWIQHQPKSM